MFGRWGVMPIAAMLGALATIASTQEPTPEPPPPCSSCHTCTQPAAGHACLRTCSRPALTPSPQESGRLGPGIVLLDMLKGVEAGQDRFGPVPFDHAGHARMAEMTAGCVACHHYTPAGQAHPACRTCHEIAPTRTDIRRPGLKGAYHRQCLNCHREWSHETKCSVCHFPLTGQPPGTAAGYVPTKDDIMGLMHPPIPEPETVAYESAYGGVPGPSGTTVLFRHREHINRFGLQCVDCHHEPNCSRCHAPQEFRATIAQAPREHHRPCMSCHATQDPVRCNTCHIAPRFTHEQVGWKLGPYHAGVQCRRCHNAVPFARLPKDCDACHRDWSPQTFDHAVTGQRLDDTHAAHDCSDCHPQRRFNAPPTCDECHEEEEGIVFPARRPGPLVE